MEDITLIKELFKNNGILINDEQATKFDKYYQFLIEYNKNINLTSITEYNEVIVKHFVDCVLNYKHYTKNATVCDIGTGAGFPGVPLKIMRPDLNITLVDSLNKRIAFLNNLTKLLQLDNLTAIHTRAQELQQFVSHETFDYTITRAVAPLNELIELCIPYTKVNGELVALKSLKINDEIQNSKNAFNQLNCKLERIDNFVLKLNNTDYKRSVVYILKTDITPKQFPRPKNKIKTNPL